jgi:hypothetical protein
VRPFVRLDRLDTDKVLSLTQEINGRTQISRAELVNRFTTDFGFLSQQKSDSWIDGTLSLCFLSSFLCIVLSPQIYSTV